MKFKLDENLGKSSAEILKSAGLDVITVHDEKLCGAADDYLFAIAVRESRCLITLDLDFSNILRFPPFETPGIIILRPAKQSEITQIHALLNQLTRALETNHPAGSIWVVERNQIRIHPGDSNY